MFFFLVQGECQPALCAEGKLFEESGRCVSAIEQILGLGYKLFLVLNPEETTYKSSEEVQSLADDLAAWVLNISEEGEVELNISMTINNSCSSCILGQVSVFASFIGNESLSRDEFEADVLERFTAGWSSTHKGTKVEVTLKTSMLGNGFKSPLQGNSTEEKCFTSLPTKHIEVRPQPNLFPTNARPLSEPQEVLSSILCDSIVSNSCLPEGNRVVFSKFFSSIPPMTRRVPIWRFKDIFIDVNYSLSCPYVSVNISETGLGTDYAEISFSYMGDTFTKKGTDGITLVNGELHMCIDTFKNITGRRIIEEKQRTLERVRYYLEIVCLSLSIICLSISAITYCLFRSLRSLPGLNNLSLCVSLAAAQVCLLITTCWGQEERLSRGYCMAHAVLLHFFWLSAFAWMSTCCIHMYRVFTTHDNKFLDGRSDGKRFGYYCIYGFGLPALVVLATYALNAGVSSGDRSGYNSEICFLDTRHSAWTFVLTLLVPLLLVLLTNSIMFALTIREIASVSRVRDESRIHQGQSVTTYVKLSSLTGLLGTVFVIAIRLDIKVLSLLTSPLMALQGVFIFVSFICTEKVRLLYLDLLQNCGIPCRSQVKAGSNSNSTGKVHTAPVVNYHTASTHV